MPVRVNVDKSDLDKLVGNIRRTARVQLAKELDKAMVDAGNVLEKAIRATTDVYMPGGYESVFKRALVIAVKLVKGATRRVTLTGRAFGAKGHDRQVEVMEDEGRLKHPVFTRKVWRWQKIRPGWMSEPATNAAPEAAQQVDQAAKRIINHLTRGL